MKFLRNLKNKKGLALLVLLGLLFIAYIIVRADYKGNPIDRNWKEITLTGCSATDYPPQKYTLGIPGNWNITKVNKSFDEGNYITGENPPGNFYYSVEGDEKKFMIGCMIEGTKGGGCNRPYTEFTVNGVKRSACYGQQNGEYFMGILYMPTDPKTQSTTAFWAEGIDKTILDKIFNTFKFE